MKYRHEWKHIIGFADCLELRTRLRAVMAPDPHAGADGRYFIRSLYFDNLEDKALREKLDGLDKREKFRVRYYSGDTGLLHLEKKSKLRGLCAKEQEELSVKEVRWLLNGDLGWMAQSPGRSLVHELYRKMTLQGLRPRTIVDYTREPFVYPPGNVRVTLDYDIRTSLSPAGFLDPGCVTIPAGDPAVVLEVKWDEFLPDPIRAAVQLRSRRAAAFSKYAACRVYG